MRKLTRRQSIAALAGGGVAMGALGIGLYASDEPGLVRSILGRAVGPFDMQEGDFSAFVADLDSEWGWTADAGFALFRLASAADPDVLLSYSPSAFRGLFEKYERKVVTNFLTRTDYLQIDPRTRKVSFIGDAGCRSPYARFELA